MFSKYEMKMYNAPPSPTVDDLTSDERAWLNSGGCIDCELVNGQWVKRKVGPGNHKALTPRRSMKRVGADVTMSRLALKLKLLELEA